MKNGASATTSLLILLITSAMTACAPEDIPDEVDSTTAAVTGGTPVDNVDPYDGVVRIKQPDTGATCTASKIGEAKYLTAAHCIVPLTQGNQIEIATDPEGIDFNTYTLARTDVHPSYRLAVDLAYDVATFTIDTDIDPEPANVRTLALRNSYVPVGQQGILVGYGCDATSTDDGTKQDAPVQAYNYPEPQTATLRLTSISSTVSSCDGDSGGPFLIRTGIGTGPWQIAGVVQTSGVTTDPSDPPTTRITLWSRTGNVRRWIETPVVNSFFHGEVGIFLSGDSGKCLGLDGASPSPGARVRQYYCDGRDQPVDHQYWRLHSIGGGYFLIYNTKSNLCVGVGGGSTQDGAIVAQYGCDPTPTTTENQAWRFVLSTSGGGGYYQIKNGKSGKCIGIDGGLNNNGAVASQFTCAPLGGRNNQTFLYAR